MAVDQAVILCGGLGTRLGALTRDTPKPLLPVGGRPFLARLIWEVRRYGFRRILLLAAFRSDQMDHFAASIAAELGLEVTVSIEPELAGTAGALFHALSRLDDIFVLMNGDSWFDFNLLDLVARATERSWAGFTIALRSQAETARSGTVELDGDHVTEFSPRPVKEGTGLINGGVYVVQKSALAALPPRASLERDVLPAAAQTGRVAGFRYEGFFIDIGVPEAYAAAEVTVPARQRRRAVFLDRDGVLNHDFGHVGTIDRFQWCDGAIAAVKRINDRGWFAFVVTNQSGVARGLYSEASVNALHAHLQAELHRAGAHIDDFRYSPFHPEGSVKEYARESDWRKPAPGMVLDLLATWPIEPNGSFLVGNRPSDIEAAEGAGLPGTLIPDCGLSAALIGELMTKD